MPPAKHKLTMDKAMGLISLLSDVTASQAVHFHQPQQVQCTHHGLTFVLLCVPAIFADPDNTGC